MFVFYKKIYIGGIIILKRLKWGMAQKRLGNTDILYHGFKLENLLRNFKNRILLIRNISQDYL